MNKISTDIEQSKRLLELGIDAETADMYWKWLKYSQPKEYNVKVREEGMMITSPTVAFPAWSLTALLQLMPKDKEVTWELSYGGWGLNPIHFVGKFFITYETEDSETIHTECAVEPIDAVVDMIVWLKEQKII